MFSDVSDWLKRHQLDIGIVVILFLFTFIIRLATTIAYPIEVGLDGAYYTINVTSLLTGGYLYYDAPILSFGVATFFTLLFGGDAILGVKVTSAFFGGLLNVGVYFAARTFSGGDWRAGLIAATVCAFDSTMFQMVTSLVKNEAALAFLPIAMAFFYRFVAQGKRSGDLIGYVIFGLFATLSHLVTVAWLFASLIGFGVYEFLKRVYHRQGFDGFREILFPLLVSGIIFLGTYLIFDALIPSADTWYTSSSLLKASGYSTSLESLSTIMSILAFAQLYPPQFPFVVEFFRLLFLEVMVVFTLIGIAICLFRNRPGDRAATALWTSNILLGLVLGTWLFRFQAMHIVPAAILLGMGLVILIDNISTGISEISRTYGRRWYPPKKIGLGLTFAFVISFAALGTPFLLWTSSNNIQPIVDENNLESIEMMQGLFPDNTKLYAEHGINYFITSRTGYESPPDWGDSDWPVYCAWKMLRDHVDEGRPSYYVISSVESIFYESFKPLANKEAKLVSIENFDLIKTALNVTIKVYKPINSIYCNLRFATNTALQVSTLLTQNSDDYWTAVIDLSELPDGLFEVYITRREIASSSNQPINYWFGFYLYHYSSLPESRVPLQSLIHQVSAPGTYRVFGVNLTTAKRINLLDQEVKLPRIASSTDLPAIHMLLITPFFFFPHGVGEISTFLLLLILCPLTTVYWMGIANALSNKIQNIPSHISKSFRTTGFGGGTPQIAGQPRRWMLQLSFAGQPIQRLS